MPSWSIQPKPGFEGCFTIVSTDASSLSPDEKEFVRRVDKMMSSYANVDVSGGFGQLRISARKESLARLRRLVEDVVSGKLLVQLGISSTFICQGHWEAALARISSQPFVVNELDASGKILSAADSSLPSSLAITVADLPIPMDKINFKVDVDRTLMVFNVVLGADRKRQWFGSGDDERLRRRARYIRELRGVSRLGLQSSDPSLILLARQSLTALQEEFLSMEASSVKNSYLRRLGWRCLLASLISVSAYWYVTRLCPVDYTLPSIARICQQHPILFAFRNFFLLTAGAAVGTWLSFSLRRVILSFLDLAALEEDQMDPTNRVLFITALSSVVGLLFWAGAVSIGIGDFRSDIAGHGAWALLIGLLLGMAERTMATAVSKRAADFAGAIGSK